MLYTRYMPVVTVHSNYDWSLSCLTKTGNWRRGRPASLQLKIYDKYKPGIIYLAYACHIHILSKKVLLQANVMSQGWY